jgi:hypothetical protein
MRFLPITSFLAERRSINISPRTATLKIALLTYPALDIGNKPFIKFTALDIIQSRLSKLEKSDEQDPLHKWIGYYNHHVIEFRKFLKWLYASHVPQEKSDNFLRL